MIIKVEAGQAVGHPILEENFRYLFTDVSFPLIFTKEIVEVYGYGMYEYSRVPDITYTQKLVEGTPVKDEYGIWRQTWNIIELEGEERETAIKKEQFEYNSSLMFICSKRLDRFANKRGYQSMLTACSYATSKNDIYRSDAQYCVDLRDKTWQSFYQIINPIIAGTSPRITQDEMENLLPPLQWPDGYTMAYTPE